MAVLGLRFCARAFSSCGKRGPLFIAVRGPLTIAPSLVAEHRLQTRRLSNCGSRAQSLHGMWDSPRPGPEPASPALAGRLSTTVPPGKPQSRYFLTTSEFLRLCPLICHMSFLGGGRGKHVLFSQMNCKLCKSGEASRDYFCILPALGTCSAHSRH